MLRNWVDLLKSFHNPNILKVKILFYQLDFVTPGSLPWDASILKQILQIPNFLINALGLPHIGHLL
jgi:hypothetical protein